MSAGSLTVGQASGALTIDVSGAAVPMQQPCLSCRNLDCSVKTERAEFPESEDTGPTLLRRPDFGQEA
jgi:hypothetical protein